MEPEPFVSIITLNYNQTEITCQFLESTRALQYRNYEILVCDMASDADPAPLISAGNYPHTTLYKCKTNLGFAGGNNWGMRQAKGDFIFIINNDTEVTPDCISSLLSPFYKNPAIGVTSPKIRFFDQPDIIQYAGFNKMNHLTGRTSTRGEMEKDYGQYDASGPTYAAHGCAMMIKRALIDRLGMFPEKFFLYYEEWDWSARITRAGYVIWYCGNALIYHKESMTVGKKSPIKVYYLTRNRILYMRRNSGFYSFIVFSMFFTFFSAPKSVLRFLINRQFQHLKFFLKGVAWNLYSPNSSAV